MGGVESMDGRGLCWKKEEKRTPAEMLRGSNQKLPSSFLLSFVPKKTRQTHFDPLSFPFFPFFFVFTSFVKLQIFMLI